MVTLESKVKDVYENPIGHDLMAKILLQMGIDEKRITGFPIGNLKLKTLKKMTSKKLGADFFDALLNLLNMEKDLPGKKDGEVTKQWWKEAVFYQIYPRSFCDTNHDGIGDLEGIISKLDYLKDLGVNALWLSPVYDSPNDDNGYDIRDYRKIMKEFGTMEEFDRLLSCAHERGIRLIMDLVINHTSDEHEWFQKALEEPDGKYGNYYIFKDGDESEKPNNWTSFFSGDAWNYYPKNHKWALHLFSKKQMDLNWECEDLRKDVYEMIRFWLSKGVDGFRMDVINLISKAEGLPDGNATIGGMMGLTGIENYFYGPKLHQYLREIRKEAFDPFHAFSVGETPGLGMNMARLVTGEERKELDMIFSFDHLETPGHIRFEPYRYDLNYYKKYMISWMEGYGNNCWMSLFLNNHDNPRMISKVNPDEQYRYAIGSLLACMQMTLKGTPFVFQGDEMGLVNYPFASMKEIRDVESINYYDELLKKGKTEEEAFEIILSGTRDHARVLLPWEDGVQKKDAKMLADYKQLIVLRKQEEAFIYGSFKVLLDKQDRFVYERATADKRFVIDCNLGQKEQNAYPCDKSKCRFTNKGTDEKLFAYEARIYELPLN